MMKALRRRIARGIEATVREADRAGELVVAPAPRCPFVEHADGGAINVTDPRIRSNSAQPGDSRPTMYNEHNVPRFGVAVQLFRTL